jgi:hypothetical protein
MTVNNSERFDNFEFGFIPQAYEPVRRARSVLMRNNVLRIYLAAIGWAPKQLLEGVIAYREANHRSGPDENHFARSLRHNYVSDMLQVDIITALRQQFEHAWHRPMTLEEMVQLVIRLSYRPLSRRQPSKKNPKGRKAVAHPVPKNRGRRRANARAFYAA